MKRFSRPWVTGARRAAKRSKPSANLRWGDTDNLRPLVGRNCIIWVMACIGFAFTASHVWKDPIAHAECGPMWEIPWLKKPDAERPQRHYHAERGNDHPSRRPESRPNPPSRMHSNCGRGLAPDSGGSVNSCINCKTAIGSKPPPTKSKKSGSAVYAKPALDLLLICFNHSGRLSGRRALAFDPRSAPLTTMAARNPPASAVTGYFSVPKNPLEPQLLPAHTPEFRAFNRTAHAHNQRLEFHL